MNFIQRNFGLAGSIAILCLLGCGAEGEHVDESGEFVGAFEQKLGARGAQEANDGGDRVAYDVKICSTPCECGRIWHRCDYWINCDYWCGKIEDQESAPGCGSGDGEDDGANESIDERDPQADAPARRPARGPVPAEEERDDANGDDGRAADACYSICGDPSDEIICGPHACTPEAAGSCCPEVQRRAEQGQEPVDRDQEELAEDALREAADQDDQDDEPHQARPIRASLTAEVTFNPRRRVCRVTLNATSTRNVFLRAPAAGTSDLLLTRNPDRVYRTLPTSYGWSRTFIVRPGSYSASLHATDGRRVYREALSQARIRCGVVVRNPRVSRKAAERVLRNRGGLEAAQVFGAADE